MVSDRGSGARHPAGLLVSVVVPVHNGGAALEDAIASALDQTLPHDRYEVIFVDDGSTDGSGERLDAAAAAYPNVVVIHTPASGSPGPPRNLGIERARGEYIQFLDADDRLGPRALERQLEMARANDADLVIGKLASNFRGVHWALYRKTVEAGSLTTVPVMGSLTPHKMFRTAMIREHGLRFPEGWRLIEDQDFVVRSYIAARTISVVADEACYFYAGREDGQNLTLQAFDPDEYYDHLRQILEGVAKRLEPGPARTEVFRRFYHVEMLGKLEGDAFLAMPPAARLRLLDAVRRLAVARIGDDVHESLPAFARTRSTLLREGRLDDLVALAERAAGLRLDAVALAAAPATEGLRVRYRVQARWPDDTPFVLAPAGHAWRLDPRLVPDGLVPDGDRRVDATAIQVQAALHEQGGFLEWMVRAGASVRLEPSAGGTVADARRPVATGTVIADPGAPGPSRRALGAGRWSAILRLRGLGIDLRAPLAASPDLRLPDAPWLLADPAGVAHLDAGPGGVVELVVEGGVPAVRAALDRRPALRLAHGRTVELRWPVATGPATRAVLDLALAARPDAAPVPLSTAVHTATGRPGMVDVRARIEGRPEAAGRPLELRLAGLPVAAAGIATSDDAGGLRLAEVRAITPAGRVADGLAGLRVQARSLAARVVRRVSGSFRRR